MERSGTLAATAQSFRQHLRCSSESPSRQTANSARNASRRLSMAARTLLDIFLAAVILCAGVFVGAALLGIIH